jgi:hypothetical protein
MFRLDLYHFQQMSISTLKLGKSLKSDDIDEAIHD